MYSGVFKSAVAAVALATMVCGYGSSNQENIDNKNNVDMSNNIIEVENMTQEEYIDFTESLEILDYSYEKSMLNGDKPLKMTNNSNFKFEYNQEGYLVKQTIINNDGNKQLELTYTYTKNELGDTVLSSREDRIVETDEVLRFVDYSNGKETYYNNSDKEIKYELAEFIFFEDWSLYEYNAATTNADICLQIDFNAGTRVVSEYDKNTMMPLKILKTDKNGNITETSVKCTDYLVREIEQKINSEIYRKTIYEYNEAGIESGCNMIV